MSEQSGSKARWHNSISLRLPLLFIVSLVLLTTFILYVVYSRFEARMVDEYGRMAMGVTNLMADAMDPDRIDEYMEKNYELDEYNELIRRFSTLRENYPDVLYMYVYRVDANADCHVILDLDAAEDDEGDPPGSIYELDEAFLPYLDDLVAGREVPPLTGNTIYGYQLSYLRPVFDSRGNCVCHVGVDFSMDYLHRQDILFVYSLSMMVLLVVALILLTDIYVVRKSITGPLNAIAKCTKQFTFETEEDRQRNIDRLNELNIRTKDEIEDLYDVFRSVMHDSLTDMKSLAKAQSDIQGKDEQIQQISRTAYRDALTGVGNKASFNKASAELTQELSKRFVEFGVVMADVNNLKYINDTYGHEAGDRYIKGCCKMICDMFKRSSVFRIGGDEFVVLLKNEDYTQRLEKLEQLTAAFEAARAQEHKDAWERYSASLGMSECTEEDETVGEVLKRADAAMYENKMRFKEAHGSYR